MVKVFESWHVISAWYDFHADQLWNAASVFKVGLLNISIHIY